MVKVPQSMKAAAKQVDSEVKAAVRSAENATDVNTTISTAGVAPDVAAAVRQVENATPDVPADVKPEVDQQFLDAKEQAVTPKFFPGPVDPPASA